jgi:hypothetical protein
VIQPDADVVLASVIAAVENDIAPEVSDEYAASLCRTVAQMLRSVRARVRLEQVALAEDNRELRQLLRSAAGRALPGSVRGDVDAAVEQEPPLEYPAVAALQADAFRLRHALARVIEAVPEEDDALRVASRDYLRHQLERERTWQQDAFTGPRR